MGTLSEAFFVCMLVCLQGLVFMWQRKVGLGVSWTWGSGFVIANLARGVWSPPCFIKDRLASVGVTAGFRTMDLCIAIPTEAGMAKYQVGNHGGVATSVCGCRKCVGALLSWHPCCAVRC